MKLQAFKRFSDEELLTGLVFGEARRTERSFVDELFEWVAIAQVVQNRKYHNSWPSTIQEVILQKGQFSCFNENDPNNEKIYFFLVNKSPTVTYERMRTVATMVLFSLTADLVKGATHYVAEWFYKDKKGTDHWCRRMQKTFSAGGHVFLK